MTDLAALLARQTPGRTLTGAFYRDPAVHQAELRRIWQRYWLFATHSCELAEPGRFMTVQLGDEPLVVVRGSDGRVRGFFNVCRHRGSRVCASDAGRVHRLVCPYHAWTYGLDGKLHSDVREHGGDPATLGLREVATVECEGLIFLRVASDGIDFDQALTALAPRWRPQGMARARVAKRVDYRVAANWKVIFENNRECFHCPVAHPEYIRANYDIAVGDERHEAKLAARIAAEAPRWQAIGLEAPTLVSDMTASWYRTNRTPLVPGFVTESLDGKPVAPVMGEYQEHDVGTLRSTIFPNFWMHGSGDHAVTTRLLPDGPDATQVRVTWLVDANAQEGRDYDLDRLLPFWQRTSEQDWTICENVQRGTASQSYAPGPLARVRERNVAQFIDWYLEEMRT
jgi:Rieske 2Fe-2S family protein